jgi:hypothetical protein
MNSQRKLAAAAGFALVLSIAGPALAQKAA